VGKGPVLFPGAIVRHVWDVSGAHDTTRLSRTDSFNFSGNITPAALRNKTTPGARRRADAWLALGFLKTSCRSTKSVGAADSGGPTIEAGLGFEDFGFKYFEGHCQLATWLILRFVPVFSTLSSVRFRAVSF
jgi:hypothetical protein